MLDIDTTVNQPGSKNVRQAPSRRVGAPRSLTLLPRVGNDRDLFARDPAVNLSDVKLLGSTVEDGGQSFDERMNVVAARVELESSFG
jgi:hypothetical protein